MLTIDVSGSVDNHFKLQCEGIAAALESEEVAAALSNGICQTIEIAVVEWAEEQRLNCQFMCYKAVLQKRKLIIAFLNRKF